MSKSPHQSAKEYLEKYPELDTFGDGTLTVKFGKMLNPKPPPEGVDYEIALEDPENPDPNVVFTEMNTTQCPPIVMESGLSAIKSLRVSMSSTQEDDERVLHHLYGKTRDS